MSRRDANKYPWQRYRIENQHTQPLPAGNLSFRMYLSMHRLSLFEVARVSGMRPLTIWNIEHNIPISVERATIVRAGLRRMTGVAYTGSIVVHPVEHPVYQHPAPHGRRDHELF